MGAGFFFSSRVQSFAMGSAEGFQQADAAITAAAKRGTWILLKNVHLAPAWSDPSHHSQYFALDHSTPRHDYALCDYTRALFKERAPGSVAPERPLCCGSRLTMVCECFGVCLLFVGVCVL